MKDELHTACFKHFFLVHVKIFSSANDMYVAKVDLNNYE